MTVKAIALSTALAVSLAGQAVAQSNYMSMKPKTWSFSKSFSLSTKDQGRQGTGEGAHFECHWDDEHDRETCDIIVIVCPEQDAECIELP